jgi:glycosyltransferase involved in cell wall biosynthesis
MLPAKLTISVVIPVYNGGASFRYCLSNLAKAVPAPCEIIVVADGDTDGSWLLAKEFSAKVLRIPTRSGPAKARNLGAIAAQSDIIFFVDADVAICPDTISQVAIAFSREPDLAALIGSYDDAPGATNFLSQYKNLFHHYVHQTAREEASTFWGACGAIRREVFLSIGGFNESYRQPSTEDIELGYRLKQAGHRIHLCKSLQVKHLKRWGVVSLLKADFFYRALPWTELILRDRALINDLNLQLKSRLSVMLTFALLSALVGAWWWPGFLAVAVVLSVSLAALNYSLLVLIGAAIIALYLANMGLALWVRYITVRITKTTIQRFRIEIWKKLYTFSHLYYSQLDQSQLHTIVVQDTQRLDIMSNALVAQVIPAVLICAVLSVVLITINLLLFLALASVAPIIYLLNITLGKQVKRWVRAYHRTFELFSKGMLFVIQNMELTRIQGAEDYEIVRQRKFLSDEHRTSRYMTLLSDVYRLSHDLILVVSFVILLIAGGIVVGQGYMTSGEIFSFGVAVGLMKNHCKYSGLATGFENHLKHYL